jgi:hypothetical protein
VPSQNKACGSRSRLIRFAKSLGSGFGTSDRTFRCRVRSRSDVAVRRGHNIASFVWLNSQPVPSSISSNTMLREDIESLEFATSDSILVVGHRHTCLRNLYRAEFIAFFTNRTQRPLSVLWRRRVSVLRWSVTMGRFEFAESNQNSACNRYCSRQLTLQRMT